MKTPWSPMSQPRAPVMTGSSGLRGGRSMMFGSTGSTPEGQGRQAVGHQVDPEDLDGQERHREADQGRDEHDQDLAEVAGQQEVDELADVVVDAPAFLDGGHDRGEVVVGDDHVRDFLGHVRAGDAHGHADVGLLDRRRVVDAVAGHGHDLAPPPPGPHDPELVLGRDAGVDGHVLHRPRRAPRRSGGRRPRRSGPGSRRRRSRARGRWPRRCSCGRR